MQTSRLSRHIPNPTKETLSPVEATPHPLPPVLGTTNPLAVSADLPVLDISHQWSPTPCVILPASPTEHRVRRVHPRCSLPELHSFSWLRRMKLCWEMARDGMTGGHQEVDHNSLHEPQ